MPSVSAPIVAQHTLARVAAGHVREFTFECRSNGPAVEPTRHAALQLGHFAGAMNAFVQICPNLHRRR